MIFSLLAFNHKKCKFLEFNIPSSLLPRRNKARGRSPIVMTIIILGFKGVPPGSHSKHYPSVGVNRTYKFMIDIYIYWVTCFIDYYLTPIGRTSPIMSLN